MSVDLLLKNSILGNLESIYSLVYKILVPSVYKVKIYKALLTKTNYTKLFGVFTDLFLGKFTKNRKLSEKWMKTAINGLTSIVRMKSYEYNIIQKKKIIHLIEIEREMGYLKQLFLHPLFFKQCKKVANVFEDFSSEFQKDFRSLLVKNLELRNGTDVFKGADACGIVEFLLNDFSKNFREVYSDIRDCRMSENFAFFLLSYVEQVEGFKTILSCDKVFFKQLIKFWKLYKNNKICRMNLVSVFSIITQKINITKTMIKNDFIKCFVWEDVIYNKNNPNFVFRGSTIICNLSNTGEKKYRYALAEYLLKNEIFYKFFDECAINSTPENTSYKCLNSVYILCFRKVYKFLKNEIILKRLNDGIKKLQSSGGMINRYFAFKLIRFKYYSKELNDPEFEICGFCNKRKKCLRCDKCKWGRFCSVECQKMGWKEHKPLCDEISSVGNRLVCDNPFCEEEKGNLLRCGGCKNFYYCNASCQKKHWKLSHKKECKKWIGKERIKPKIITSTYLHKISRLIREEIAQGKLFDWKKLREFTEEKGLDIYKCIVVIDFRTPVAEISPYSKKEFVKLVQQGYQNLRCLDFIERKSNVKGNFIQLHISLGEYYLNQFVNFLIEDKENWERLSVFAFMSCCKIVKEMSFNNNVK